MCTTEPRDDGFEERLTVRSKNTVYFVVRDRCDRDTADSHILHNAREYLFPFYRARLGVRVHECAIGVDFDGCYTYPTPVRGNHTNKIMYDTSSTGDRRCDGALHASTHTQRSARQ